MDLEDGLDPDESPEDLAPLLPPDDRLWRHPSEVDDNPFPAPAKGPAHAAARPSGDGRIWAVALVAGAVGALLATGVEMTGAGFHTTRTIRTIEQVAANPPRTISTATTTVDEGVESVAERARPAIVRLDADTPAGKTVGSGVLFRSDGQILTSERVVRSATHIEVTTATNRHYDGQVVGSDPDTDVAVVRVNGPGPWPVAVIGSAAGLRAGQSILALGSPVDLAGGTSVSRGVISGVGRELSTSDGALLDMIQTDATIAPGFAGGALVDLTGAVVGLTTSIAAASDPIRMGYATPIDIAHRVAEELLATGHAAHVWLGITGGDLDTNTAAKLGIDGGAWIDTVQKGSPAAKAGMRHGDIVSMLDSNPVNSMSELMVTLRSHTPGDVVMLGILRAGQPLVAIVTLGSRPND